MTTAAISHPPSPVPAAYVVAVSTPPDIVCPSWCAVSRAEHIADLENMDGRLIHWTNDLTIPGIVSLGVSWVTLTDGTMSEDGPARVYDCDRPDHPMTPAQARDVAAALVTLANIAEGDVS